MKALNLFVCALLFLFLFVGSSYSKCSDYEKSTLKKAGYTEKEVSDFCQDCSLKDYIDMSASGKNKDAIDLECKKKDTIDKEDKIPSGRMLFLKPAKLTIKGDYTDTAVRTTDDATGLTKTNTGTTLFDFMLTYSLPFSSIHYVGTDAPKKTPPYLLKAFSLVAEGHWGNTITDENSLLLKTETKLSYKIGLKFETTLDKIFPPRNEDKYKTSEKYVD